MTFREMNVVEEDSEGNEEKEDMMRINSVQGAVIKTNLGVNDFVDKETRKNQLLKLKQGQRIDQPKMNNQPKRNGNREQQQFQSIVTQAKI